MSELESDKKWWQAFITPQNILTAVLAVFAAGGYWQDAKQTKERVTRLEQANAQLDERITREREISDLIYMRRDVLTEQLRMIQEEQLRQRELMQLVRREVR